MSKTFKTKQKICVLIFSIVAMGVVLISFLYYYAANNSYSLKKNMTVNVTTCIQPGPDILQVSSSEWKDNFYYIEATVSPNCGYDKIISDYEITSNNLTILYKSTSGLFDKGETACLCPTQLRIGIKDIPKKDYNVSIKYSDKR